MEGKIFIYGFCIAALIGGAVFWRYTMEIDDAQAELLSRRNELNATVSNIQTSQAWLVARKEAAALLEAIKVLDQENQKLRTDIAALQRTKEATAKNFISTIQRGRESAVGLAYPELALSTGQVYRQVIIQKVAEDVTHLRHSEGVTQVETGAMPIEFLNRVRFGATVNNLGASSNDAGSYIMATGTYPVSLEGVDFRPVRAPSTAASDSLVRQSMASRELVPNTPQKKSKSVFTPSTPTNSKVDGDPGLWKSVTRQSIGRAYIPGQGWLKLGPKGPIPGSSR